MLFLGLCLCLCLGLSLSLGPWPGGRFAVLPQALAAEGALDPPVLPAQGLIPVDTALAPVVPGDAGWGLGVVPSGQGRVGKLALQVDGLALHVDQQVRSEAGAPTFRLDYALPQQGAALFAGGESRERRNLHKARGISFSVRASQPVAGLLLVSTANPDNPQAVDTFFGSFGIGTGWKTLRIPFRHMAVARAGLQSAGPHPTGPQSTSLQPTGQPRIDAVLRPDSVVSIRIGLDGQRAPTGPGSLWVGDISFFR